MSVNSFVPASGSSVVCMEVRWNAARSLTFVIRDVFVVFCLSFGSIMVFFLTDYQVQI